MYLELFITILTDLKNTRSFKLIMHYPNKIAINFYCMFIYIYIYISYLDIY